MTSPANGSMPAGPCRAGVAVMVNVPAGLVSFVLSPGAKPSATPPSLFAPTTVVKSRGACMA